MEQNGNETKNLKELNNFTVLLLCVGIVMGIGRGFIGGLVTGVTMLSVSPDLGMATIISGVLNILMGISLIFILRCNRFGLYAFFALEIIYVILGGCLTNTFGKYIGIALMQIALMSVSLCLKKEGKTGWKTILGK